MNVDHLAQIAAQLVARVREDEPDANARWLQAVTSPQDREALLYVLAAAVPVDRTWWELTAWATGTAVDPVERRREQWRRSSAKQRAKREAA